MKFNDIRTTLQALTALLDNCNSLHTNAYDEALTTPTEESVRLAMAIQLILTREWGVYWNETALQGSYFFRHLTEEVEEAVLEEFLHLNARGGVLRAMETQYQRFKIQEQSLLYQTRKHSGELPVVGVDTFLRAGEEEPQPILVSRATNQEKDDRLKALRGFQERHREASGPALERLREQVRKGATSSRCSWTRSKWPASARSPRSSTKWEENTDGPCEGGISPFRTRSNHVQLHHLSDT